MDTQYFYPTIAIGVSGSITVVECDGNFKKFLREHIEDDDEKGDELHLFDPDISHKRPGIYKAAVFAKFVKEGDQVVTHMGINLQETLWQVRNGKAYKARRTFSSPNSRRRS